jgi:error-prone DNA polymerase
LEPRITLDDLKFLNEVIVLSGCRRSDLCRLILRGRYKEACQRAQDYRNILGPDNFYIELQNRLLPGDTYLNKQLIELSESLGIEAAATNNAHYATADDFTVHDLLTCVRTLSTVEEINPERPLKAESYIFPSALFICADKA